MEDRDDTTTQPETPNASSGNKSYNRRDFLKIAGLAGAAVGASGGLGGLLAACGGTTTTTTAAPTTTTAAPTTTTAAPTTTMAPSTTTVSATATGREIKIGFVTPLTGGLASFGVPDSYCVKRAQAAIGDGLMCGDGQKHPITITTSDSQSDSNRAAQVTGDLISNTKADMILAASTPDTCVPVADQAEANGVPCLTCDCPWQSYVGTRTKGDLTAVFKWTYHVFWGAEDMVANFLDIQGQVSNNKVIATMYPNDADGNALSPIFIPAYKGAGLTVVDGSGFQDGTEDFTTQIAKFKKAGAEIGTGIFIPPDFTNFWKQAIQQTWMPKVATFAKALLFPQSVEALGKIANGLTTEVWWTPNHPFTSALLNQTCQQFAADFEATQKQQWTQPLLHFLIFEWAIDVLKRATSVDDKNAIMTAVKATKLDTIAGPIDFTAPVEPKGPPWTPGPRHVVENVYKSPLVGGQWRSSTKYPLNNPGQGFDLTVVSNDGGSMITVQDKAKPYTGS
jgi:branched-chain amino acid transport system substrate-binding protein